VRLLRCPALVEALYFNKNARMSSVSRALELCARNGVRLDGIPAYAEMATAIMADPNAAAPSAADDAFAAVLTRADAAALALAEAGLDGVKGTRCGGIRARAKRKASASFIKFDELKIFEKIRLATIGNAYCRQV
jgi:hypothetical protein